MGIFDVFKGKSDMEIAGDNQVDELDKGKVKEFDLNIEKILENWENYHAIREIIANALDEQVLTNTRDIEIKQAKDGWWHIVDYGRGLNYHHLTQNENEEKSWFVCFFLVLVFVVFFFVWVFFFFVGVVLCFCK